MRKQILAGAVIAGLAGSMAANADTASGESTTVGGKAFIDFTNINQKSNDVKTDASGTGLDVKRFYIAIDHKFDDMWSANVTTDFNYVSNDSETQVFIKKAYLQAKFSDALFVRAGSADLPWVPFAEGLYGYRYVENVLIDRVKFGTSADWGLHAGGKFADGMVNYAVSAVNGAGYKNPSRSKTIDFEGRISVVPVEGLSIAAGFYNGKLGQEKETTVATQDAKRYNGLVAYVNDKFRVGAEYFQAKDWKQVLAPTISDKADGVSGWGSFNFTSEFSVFGRYDTVKPSKDLAPDLKNTYINVGLAYKPRKNVDLAFVFKQDKVEHGSFAVSNGTIGGSTDGKFNEVGIFAQVSY